MGKIEVTTSRRAEPVVEIPQGAHLIAPQAAPTDAKQALFFFTLTQRSGFDNRTQLMNWDGTSGGIMSLNTTGSNQCGVRVRISDTGTGGLIGNSQSIPTGQKYHILVSFWIDGSDVLHLVSYIWDGSDWVEAFNLTDNTTSGASLDLGASPWEMFRERGKTSQYFSGDANRVACWLGTSNAPIADISDSTVQGYFASRAVSAGPRTSVRELGDPVIDFNGAADAYQTGVHTGTWATFTKAGAQIGEVVVNDDPPTIEGEPELSGVIETGGIITALEAPVEGATPITTVLSILVNSTVVAVDQDYTILQADEGENISVLQESTNEYGTASSQSDPIAIPTPTPGDTTAPVVDIATAGTAVSNALPLTISCTERDSRPVTFDAVFVAADATAPTVAQVEAGTDSTDTATAAASWSATTATGTTATPTLSIALSAGTYDCYIVATDETDNASVAVKLIEGITLDDTVSSLSVGVTLTDITPPSPGGGDSFTYTLTPRTGPGGNIIELVPTSVQDPGDGWEVGYFEWRIDDGAGGYLTGKTVNDSLNVVTIFEGLADAVNSVEVRQVDLKHNILRFNRINKADISTQAVVGDTLRHANGATAEIVEFINTDSSNYQDRQIVLDNMSGYFAAKAESADPGDVYLNDTDTLVATMSKQPVLPRYNAPASEIRENAWETAVDVTTTTGSASVVIETQNDLTTFDEGHAVFLKAIPQGFETTWPRAELEIRWSVLTAGNTGNYESLVADFPFDRDKDYGEGDLWASRPETTGTVTYQVEAWHPDDYAGRQTATIDITFTPKATVYSAAETYAVYSGGSYGGSVSASNTYTTIDAAVAAVTVTGVTKARLLLEGGEDYYPTDMNFVNKVSDKFCIESYGTGKATLHNVEISLQNNASVTIENITINNGYDSSRPDDMTGRPRNGIVFEDTAYATVWKVNMIGVNTGIQLARDPGVTCLVDTDVYDMMEFAWWGTTVGPHAIIGSAARHHPQCSRSQGKLDIYAPWTANHAAYRSSRSNGDRVIECCDVASFATWSDNGSIQPGLRYFGQMPAEIYKVSTHRLVYLSGKMSAAPTTSGSFVTPADMVFKKIFYPAIATDSTFLNLACSGVYMENVLMLTEGTDEEFDNGVRYAISLSFGGLGIKKGAERGRRVLKNFSVINLKGPENLNKQRSWDALAVTNDSRWPGIETEDIVANMLEHAPNYSGGVDAGDFDTTGQYTPYYQGFFRYNFGELTVINGNLNGDAGDIFNNNSSNTTITGDTSGATARAKWMDRTSDKSDWDIAAGEGVLKLNAETSGTFVVGETLTFGDGTTAEVAAYTVGTYDNGGAATNTAHTGLSTALWTPLAGNTAITPPDAGVLQPWDDIWGNVRHRDGTGAIGAVERL